MSLELSAQVLQLGSHVKVTVSNSAVIKKSARLARNEPLRATAFVCRALANAPALAVATQASPSSHDALPWPWAIRHVPAPAHKGSDWRHAKTATRATTWDTCAKTVVFVAASDAGARPPETRAAATADTATPQTMTMSGLNSTIVS